MISFYLKVGMIHDTIHILREKKHVIPLNL